MVLLRRGAAAESGGKDGEGRSVTSLRRGSVQSLQRAGEHIYQARSLEVFIPAAAAVLHTRELQSNNVTNPL